MLLAMAEHGLGITVESIGTHIDIEDCSSERKRLQQEAVKLREAKDSPRSPCVPGEFRKMAAQAISARR